MSRHQFEAYLDKVFDFSSQVAAMPEGRQFPQHPWKKVFQAAFLGAACQFAALHRIETECREGALSRRIGPLSEDTIGYAFQRQDPAPLFALGCRVARRLKRNGVLDSTWARGRVVAAADGIEICHSFVRCCPTCLKRKVTHKVGGQPREDVQYYHRLSAVTVVSAAFPIPLGIRFQSPGQGEVECTLALLRDLLANLGRRYFDVLVADAAYLQKPFVQAIEQLGLDWVINLKDNQPELLTEAERATSGRADHTEADTRQQLQLWHAPEVYWPVAERSVRIVKTVRILKQNRLSLSRDPAHPQLCKKQVVSQSQQGTNFYASNIELGSIAPVFIHQLGRSRWRIDTEVFQTITTDSHLKHPSVHQGCDQALLVLTLIRVLAYTLTMVFYHRQVRSHLHQTTLGFCDLAHRLAYLFRTIRLDSS